MCTGPLVVSTQNCGPFHSSLVWILLYAIFNFRHFLLYSTGLASPHYQGHDPRYDGSYEGKFLLVTDSQFLHFYLA